MNLFIIKKVYLPTSLTVILLCKRLKIIIKKKILYLFGCIWQIIVFFFISLIKFTILVKIIHILKDNRSNLYLKYVCK